MKKFHTTWLIDDDEIFRFSAERIIEISGFSEQIRCFSNGYEALEAIKHLEENNDQTPDIVFLDINMPVLDGWQVLDAIKDSQVAKNLKIYMLSSSIDEADINKAKQYSMVSKYIAKPISSKLLAEFC